MPGYGDSGAAVNETALQRAIRVAASQAGHRLFRNNVGACQDVHGRWIRYGLATGSADLVGIQRGTGRFISIEVKRRGRLTPEQRTWLAMILEFGGLAGEARSVEEAALIWGA